MLTFYSSQKFYKLKKESEKLLNADSTEAPASTATPTPRKGKAAKTNDDGTPVKATPAKRKKKAAATTDDDSVTPSKKIKVEAEAEGTNGDAVTEVAGEPKVKAENENV